MSHQPEIDSYGEIKAVDVPFTKDAVTRLFTWQNETTERCNEEGSDTLTSIASKLEIYAVRFCLILSLADWCSGVKKKPGVDVNTVDRAIRLTEYFRSTAAAVQGIVNEDGLSEVQSAVMSELPSSFTTAEGVAIADKNGMKERTFKKFLRDKLGVFFTRETHGSYSKLFIYMTKI